MRTDAETLTATVLAALIHDVRHPATPQQRTRSLELLGKHLGMFDGRQPPVQHLHLHGVSDEERRYMVARAQRATRVQAPTQTTPRKVTPPSVR